MLFFLQLDCIMHLILNMLTQLDCSRLLTLYRGNRKEAIQQLTGAHGKANVDKLEADVVQEVAEVHLSSEEIPKETNPS